MSKFCIFRKRCWRQINKNLLIFYIRKQIFLHLRAYLCQKTVRPVRCTCSFFWVLPNNPIFCTVRCDMWGRKSWRCRPCLLTMKTLAPQLCCEFHPDLSRDLAGHLLPVPCRIQNVLRIMPMPWYQGRLGQCCFFCHRPHRIFTLS